MGVSCAASRAPSSFSRTDKKKTGLAMQGSSDRFENVAEYALGGGLVSGHLVHCDTGGFEGYPPPWIYKWPTQQDPRSRGRPTPIRKISSAFS